MDAPFFSPGFGFVEKSGLAALCIYFRKPYAYTSDRTGPVDLPAEEAVEFGGYEQRGVCGGAKRHRTSVMGRFFGAFASRRSGPVASWLNAVGIAHEKGKAIGLQAAPYKVEHACVDHLVHDEAGVVCRIIARKHLPVHGGVLFGHVAFDVRYSAWLLSPGMVDEIFGIGAELFVENLAVEFRDAFEVVNAVLRESAGNAGTYVPDIGDRAVGPKALYEGPFVKHPDIVGHVLCRDIKRDFRKEQVGSYARCGADSRCSAHFVHEHMREFFRTKRIKA